MEQNTERKDMSTREFIEYCKDNGYNSVKFHVVKDGSLICTGKVLDIYFEFVEIPLIGEGFVKLSDLEKALGHGIAFRILSDESLFDNYIMLDFMIRGREIPEKYKGE